MAKPIQPGRFTAELDGDFVVFVIGMRLNKLWKVNKWFPVFLSMPPMLKELASHPEKGMLGFWTARSGRTTVMVQYWRSFEQLEAFARNPDDPHLPAWRKFNQAIGSNGDVGIYHETYKVAARSFEAVYGNMPVFGLADAGRSVPVGARNETARQRIGADASDG